MQHDETRIRELMRTQGRSLGWLADRLGVHQSHLTRMLTGERPMSHAQLTRIAEALDVPVSWLQRPAGSGSGADDRIEQYA